MSQSEPAGHEQMTSVQQLVAGEELGSDSIKDDGQIAPAQVGRAPARSSANQQQCLQSTSLPIASSDPLPRKRLDRTSSSITPQRRVRLASFRTSRRFATHTSLGFIGLCVTLTLLIMLAVQLITREIWAECQPGVPCKWAKTQSETIADVIHTRVPKVKQYAKERDFSYFGADKSAGLYDPKRSCVISFVEGFKARVGNLSSQPQLVHELFGYLQLENSTTARAIVTDLWDKPVDFEPMVDQIATCVRQNRPLHEALCAWLDEPAMAAEFFAPPSDATNAEGLRFAMHEVLVLERFAQEARKSRTFRTFMAAHYALMKDKIEGEIVRISRNQGESEDLIKFQLEKWNSALMSASEPVFMDTEGGMPSRMAQYVQKLLMVNIIEATDIDRSIGIKENADIGLALAASVTTAVPYVDGQQNLIFSFSKEWFDAYIAWNLNYVTNFPNLHVVSSLLIPSILCTDDSNVRDHWLLSRLVTLKSAFLPGVFETTKRKERQRVVNFPYDRRRATASVVARNLELQGPVHCCGFGSLYEMWNKIKDYPMELSFGSNTARSEYFAMYYLIFAWLSVVLAGLGSEIVLGHVISQTFTKIKNGIVAWHFSQQLVFSFLLTVAFTSNDGTGLFFLPFGLWKLGFPETVGALTSFHRSKRKLSFRALSKLFDGIGTLLHHFSTSLVITAICLHIFPRSRALTAGCIVPIIQHLFVLVKCEAHLPLRKPMPDTFQLHFNCTNLTLIS